MKKGGRPKLENPRVRTIGYKITELEYKKILENAKARGLSPSSFTRLAVLKKKMPGAVVGKINLQTWIELGRIGNNINQIAKRINQNGDNNGLIDMIENLTKQIQEVRNQVIGIKDDTKF